LPITMMARSMHGREEVWGEVLLRKDR
jgi:hypothetical protein